jgi:hypothetical protein
VSGEPPPDDETAREPRGWLAIPRRLWISLTRSFRARLLLASSAVLGLTLILIGLSVNQAYTQGTWQAQRDRMQGLIYALVGAAEPDQSGELTIASDALPDPRLSRFQSGVEAVIFNEKGHAIWRSPNLSGALPKIIAPQVGDSILRKVDHDFVLSFGIRWFTGDGRPKRYTVALLQDGNNYNAQLTRFATRSCWSSAPPPPSSSPSSSCCCAGACRRCARWPTRFTPSSAVRAARSPAPTPAS